MGSKNVVPYSASFAVRGMMESLYYDLHADSECRIKTTCVYSIVVNTGLYDIKRAHVKYPKITPILTPRYVAKCIIMRKDATCLK